MLDKYNIQFSIPLAQEFNQKGMVIVPVENSPLAQLVSDSVPLMTDGMTEIPR